MIDPTHPYWESRTEEIQHAVNRRFLSSPMADRACRDDALFNAQMKWMRDMLVAMEKAMQIAHVDPRQADQVIHLLIYGTLPDGSLWPDSLEANIRIDQRRMAVVDQMVTPARIVLRPDGSAKFPETDA